MTLVVQQIKEKHISVNILNLIMDILDEFSFILKAMKLTTPQIRKAFERITQL